MRDDPNAWLARWVDAGVLDAAAAERIRSFERARPVARSTGIWVGLALLFGGVLVAAGALLFVAAHWDRLSPWARFGLAIAMVGILHGRAIAVRARFDALATTLHAAGTVAAGGGIFIAAQIFHLEAHWPDGLLLWALGAVAGAGLLRDWPQTALAALLLPAWWTSEWALRAGSAGRAGALGGISLFLVSISIAYLAARGPGGAGSRRRALAWIGGLALLPAALLLAAGPGAGVHAGARGLTPADWVAALAAPIAVTAVLRGAASWPAIVLMLWAAIPVLLDGPLLRDLVHPWAAVSGVGLCAWGIADGRPERVNLGVAAFGLAVLFFYYANVMDKLGRSISLIGLGLLFLAGGWLLERARRRLVVRADGSAA